MYNVDKLDNGEWLAQNEETLDCAWGDTPVAALDALIKYEMAKIRSEPNG